MNMKNIIKNKQNELVQGMIALYYAWRYFAVRLPLGKMTV